MENIILDRELEVFTGVAGEPNIKDNRGRAKAAIILLWIMTGVSALMVISYSFQFKMWWDSFDERIHIDVFQGNSIRQTLLILFDNIAYIVSAVFFIRWFRRSYNNLHIIDSSYLSFSEGWAAGSWFIPFLNWVRPYKIMREICEQVTEHAGKIDNRHADSSRLVSLAGWWWALWVIVPLIMRVAGYIGYNTAIIKLLLISTGLALAAYMLRIICALLAISLIKKVSAVEQVLYEEAKRTSETGRLPVTR